MTDQLHPVSSCCFCGGSEFVDPDPTSLTLEAVTGLSKDWLCHTRCFEERSADIFPAPSTHQYGPESKSETWQPGMEYFRIEFRQSGERITSATEFGWNEDDALARALATFDEFPAVDPRSADGQLEVRIGKHDVRFSTDWRPFHR